VKYLEFLKYVTNCCKDAYLNICSEQYVTLRNIFYSLSVESYLENSSCKASSLLFSFDQVSTCHTHFSNDEICISCEPERPTSVFLFFSCKMVINTTKKHGLKSVESRSAWFSTQKRNSPLSKCLPVRKSLFSLYFLYIYGLLLPMNGLLTWVLKDKYTNML